MNRRDDHYLDRDGPTGPGSVGVTRVYAASHGDAASIDPLRRRHRRERSSAFPEALGRSGCSTRSARRVSSSAMPILSGERRISSYADGLAGGFERPYEAKRVGDRESGDWARRTLPTSGGQSGPVNLTALSDKNGLMRRWGIHSFARCEIPSATSTVRPKSSASR